MSLARVMNCSHLLKNSIIWRLTPRILHVYSSTLATHHLPVRKPNPIYNTSLVRFSNVPTVDNSDTNIKILIKDSYVTRYHQVVTDPSEFIRLSVEGGGCSGFQYEFKIGSKLEEDDVLIEQDGAKLVIDTISLDLLNGASVEYHEELIRSSFRVVDIPNVESGCSCGASFSLKV